MTEETTMPKRVSPEDRADALLAAAALSRRSNVCSVARWAAASDDRRRFVDRCLSNRKTGAGVVTIKQVVAIVEQEYPGAGLSHHSLQRHARGDCSCASRK